MKHFHVLSRRSFLDRSMKIGMGVALSTLVDIPLVMKRALAEGSIGLNGKKLLFIFLRGANDSLNSIIPIQDAAYNTANRATILIPKDAATDYSVSGPCDFPVNSLSSAATYNTYPNAIRLGNGFAALHPSLKFLAPVYNAGDLALIHRVGYPRQSRSHFDSQNYWETGNPNNNLSKDGIFYRTIIESGLANTAPLTGVSIQSSLPLLLRGSDAAMTNLTDPNRYELLNLAGNLPDLKATTALRTANGYPFPGKKNRDFLNLQYSNLSNTLDIFAGINFDETGNTFRDDTVTDGDSEWSAANPSPDGRVGYYLFPTTAVKNGGWRRPDGTNQADKYVIDTGGHSFFANLKAAALILNKTDAIIAGSQIDGFDTHSAQGGVTGGHANLQRRIGWAIYALRKYFTLYADKATWDNLVVVTLSEFGRTSIENSDRGTDHAEAGAMFVAGGAVNGRVYQCDNASWPTGQTGAMFQTSGRYLKRTVDYRSVLGEVIRDHLGATQAQVNRIIPGYSNEAQEHLRSGGTVASPIESGTTQTPIVGELGIV